MCLPDVCTQTSPDVGETHATGSSMSPVPKSSVAGYRSFCGGSVDVVADESCADVIGTAINAAPRAKNESATLDRNARMHPPERRVTCRVGRLGCRLPAGVSGAPEGDTNTLGPT